jgi:hypothetical protein
LNQSWKNPRVLVSLFIYFLPIFLCHIFLSAKLCMFWIVTGDGMTGIANHAKKGQHEQFSSSVRGASAAICGLVEAAAQAAYLVGVSDPSSVAGRPGLVDQAMLNRAAQAINSACQGLSNPASSQQQVIG